MSKKKKISENEIYQDFQTITKETEPKPKIIKNCINAFWVGGLICVIGQIIHMLLIKYGGFDEETTKMLVPAIMVFLGALLTGIGVYDKIATFAGAGTLVPITGFSNSVVSPAMEFKKEGFIFGVAAKMFIIAGPVLVYGIGSSVVVGIIYYLLQRF
ncbi:stage V sporulation protein AC [Clostridium isatidis]|uniref:Stage V sporulation protein AC n=1 Tax=Clostridium isatidis TaxID=182773 RepID=A0A343JDT1_9CLOT|nr:stage V sporulation protein AC [Clostridium isatidis]ASW43689.1 stage V sporulation protein AC [Clostridium isatidis]NLZ33861.1 stage V sporulation protein AC [Clostridiales bacterium]